MKNYRSKDTNSCMEIFMDAVQELYLAKDMESITRIACAASRKLAGADGAAFVLRQENQCYFLEEDATHPLWKGSSIPLESCIGGWAMLNGEPVVSRNIDLDKRISANKYQNATVKSMIAVPLGAVDSTAAIATYWAEDCEPSKEYLTWLKALADFASFSIKNTTAMNKLEKKIADMTESLEREKKLNEKKSAFVSMASHEFRTPLTTILSSTLLVERYMETNEQGKSRKHFERIRSSVSNLTELLNEFLIIEQLELGKLNAKPEPFDLDNFLKDMMDELEVIEKPGQSILYTFCGDAQVVQDKKILKNILLNLLSNAIKYSDQNIELRSWSVNDEITIEVQDYGIGIPENEHQNIFGKFFRASNAADIKGTGLGMNIVKHYIELLNGSIDFVSEEGKGTTFTFKLPANNILKENLLIC